MKITEIINKKTEEKLMSFGDDDFENVNTIARICSMIARKFFPCDKETP